MKNLYLILLVMFSFSMYSEEGINLPIHLKGKIEKDMKEKGLNIPLEKIYSESLPSIKDAIVNFAGGCTGSIISNKGLILTNHHCGHEYFQKLSSLEDNILKNGFWAKNLGEEKRCEGLKIKITKKIVDVTKDILEGVKEGLTKKERDRIIEENIEKLKEVTEKKKYQEIVIKPFYKGNKYFLFLDDVYQDVRLVACPPSSVGNYGIDTDNWIWPKHTGDFSMFRIYVNKENNEPSEYSENNIPYKPEYFLSVNLGGVKEDDFTMVLGYPGTTNEYILSEGLKQVIENINPIGISIRDVKLNILENKMRQDELVKIKYASKYARTSNAWKKWKGQIEGINKIKGIDKKISFEKEFKLRAEKKNKKEYINYLNDLNENYKKIKKYRIEETYYKEFKMALESFVLVEKINNILDKGGEKEFSEKKEKIIKYIDKFFKDYDNDLDKEVFISLLPVFISGLKSNNIEVLKELSEENIGEYIYSNSKILDKNNFSQIINSSNSEEDIISFLKKEKLYILVDKMEKAKDILDKNIEYLEEREENLYRFYMEGISILFDDRNIYPDANFTIRVSYGNVKGFIPRDGIEYSYRTTLLGVIEKYKKDDYEFDMPIILKELYDKKDFGRYGDKGKMPVNFIATNHTSGGNSGSPVLDKNGKIIGLNFDRVWEGTMSDYNFDDKLCRNVMVDIRYVMFITEKLGLAENIISEITK